MARAAESSADRAPAPDARMAAIVLGGLAVVLGLALWPLDEPWKTRAARRLAKGIAEGRVPALKPADYVQLWLWWGILGNAVLCALLARLTPPPARPG